MQSYRLDPEYTNTCTTTNKLHKDTSPCILHLGLAFSPYINLTLSEILIQSIIVYYLVLVLHKK